MQNMYKVLYGKLQQEFEQYKLESIKWSIQDFLDYDAGDDWCITKDQAQAALEDMINNHDANNGITWNTVEYYIQKHATKIEN